MDTVKVEINESQIIKTCSHCNRSEAFANWTVFFLRRWTWKKQDSLEVVLCPACGKDEL